MMCKKMMMSLGFFLMIVHSSLGTDQILEPEVQRAKIAVDENEKNDPLETISKLGEEADRLTIEAQGLAQEARKSRKSILINEQAYLKAAQAYKKAAEVHRVAHEIESGLAKLELFRAEEMRVLSESCLFIETLSNEYKAREKAHRDLWEEGINNAEAGRGLERMLLDEATSLEFEMLCKVKAVKELARGSFT